MKITKFKIVTKNKTYPIIIGNNIIKRIDKYLSSEIKNCKKISLIIDNNIPKKNIYEIQKSLRKYSIFITYIKTNEKIKSILTVEKIVDNLLNKNFHRNDCIIALGGGILGDIAAFSASIIKRGIKFVNIPTTLLAQVDSSIGGKTGVNSKYGKNLIGTFYQPDLVLSDISILRSLPKKEVICGYAEILKHSLILNKKLFMWLLNNGNKIINLKNDTLMQKAIYASCKIKAKIITKDENENNLRAILNFGHTFAHAFETTSKFPKIINHGEAVLMGMICALEFAYQNKLLKHQELMMVKKHYRELNLQSDIKKYFKKKDVNNIIKYMKSDKKNFNENINLVLLKKIGNKPTLIDFSKNKLKVFLVDKFS